MAKLHLVCDKCDSTTFKIQKIAGHYNAVNDGTGFGSVDGVD